MSTGRYFPELAGILLALACFSACFSGFGTKGDAGTAGRDAEQADAGNPDGVAPGDEVGRPDAAGDRVVVPDGGNTAPWFDPLPDQYIEVGREKSFDMKPFIHDVQDPDDALQLAATGTGHIEASLSENKVVKLAPEEGWTGEENVLFTLTDSGGLLASARMKVKVVRSGIPKRTCETAFAYNAQSRPVSSVAVAGEFNDWNAASNPMSDEDGDGIWEASILIPAGDYGYKFVLNGADWQLDPANPYLKTMGCCDNSRLIVDDCRKPLARFEQVETDWSQRRIRITAQLFDSSAGNGVDISSLAVSMDGTSLNSPDWALAGNTLTVEKSGLAPGKHTFRFDVQDNAGAAADPLFVPAWIEEKSFSWKDAVLYFAFTDRFANGNPANDAPPQGIDRKANYQGGDFKGLKQKIEAGYFDDFGVNALWISPPYDNPNIAEAGPDGRQYSAYHGYFPISWSATDDHFGALDDLRRLVQAAHARGIRVLADLVANHVHELHPIYLQHRNDGWFNEDGVCRDVGWEVRPVTCWFEPYLPDLNLDNPDALAADVESALFWIRETDVDGFRVDAVKHMPHNFGYALRAYADRLVKKGDVSFYMVGETFVGLWQDGTPQETVKRYVSRAELDGQFDFPLYWEIVKTFARGEQGFRPFERMLHEEAGYYGENVVMGNFIGNHDVPRFISHAAGDIADLWGNVSKEQAWTNPPGQPSGETAYKKLKAVFTFLMTVYGMPLIYYGDEIGLAGSGDPDNRRFMQWSGASGLQQSVAGHLKKLGAARKAFDVLREESIPETLYVDNTFYAYGRGRGEQMIVVVFNSAQQRSVEVAVSAPDGKRYEDVLTGRSVTASGGKLSIELGQWESAVFAPR